MELIEFMFSGFWVFCGFCIVGAFLFQVLLLFWSRFMRMLMVRKHGWPPKHLDADGDWKEESNEREAAT